MAMRAAFSPTMECPADLFTVHPSVPRYTDDADHQDQPGHHTTGHSGTLNDDRPPRARHSQRRSTRYRIGAPGLGEVNGVRSGVHHRSKSGEGAIFMTESLADAERVATELVD